MRSRRSSLPDRRRATERALSALALLTLVVIGCGGGYEAPVAAPSRPHAESSYLVDPLLGYPRGVGADERIRLADAHRTLVTGGNSSAAESAARALLERNPALDPARLLLAQTAYVEGKLEAARRVAEELGELYPSYFAARLLAARSAEKVGDLVGAYGHYFELTDRSSVAAGRAEELRPRAVEVVANRIEDSLRRGRTEEASRWLSELARWAPGDAQTLEAARELAAAVGDREAELLALQRLEDLFPESRSLQIARGELELEAGDPSVGLRIFQELADEAPGDPLLAEKLARAKFLWRLTLLPEDVRQLVRQPGLTRGEFAAVVYWLFPRVRYGRSGSGTIASDVLDHPRRQEIVRVANLGLLEVDTNLHTFSPDDPQRRVSALQALLRLLEEEEPRLACLGPPVAFSGLDAQRICEAAARCGLLKEAAECLPLADLSGPAAFEMSRGALGQLGIE